MFAAGLTFSVFAQNTGVKRDIAQRGNVSVSGREAVVIRVEIAPGARTGLPTHPGDEIDGQPARPLKPGDASVIPAGTVHDAYNNLSSPLKIVGVYVVEKGKPITALVQ